MTQLELKLLEQLKAKEKMQLDIEENMMKFQKKLQLENLKFQQTISQELETLKQEQENLSTVLKNLETDLQKFYQHIKED